MLDDNNIRDRFTNSNWGEEDWLQPDSIVLEGITEELFPERKKRRFLWLWIALASLMIPVLIWAVYSRESNNSTTSMGETPIPIEAASLKSSIEKTDSEEDIDDELTSNDDNIYSKTHGLSQTINLFDDGSENNSVEGSISEEKTIVKNETTRVANNIVSKNTELTITSSANTTITSPDDQKEIRELEVLHSLPQLDLVLLDREKKDQTPEFASAGQPSFSGYNSKFSLRYGLGFSLWDLDLNRSYSDALAPANYQQVVGKAAVFRVGLLYDINDRWSAGVNFAYERAYLNSGHNSNYTYDTSTETDDRKNSSVLNMASPLGFISTPINIERAEDQNQQSTYDLLLDLDNQHVVNSLDIGLSTQYRFLQGNRWSSSAELGFGYQRITSIHNELTAVSTNHADFKAVDLEAVEEQKNYNSDRPYFSIGYILSKHINDRYDLEFAYSYRRDLNEIFESGDFSAELRRHYLQLGVKSRLSR